MASFSMTSCCVPGSFWNSSREDDRRVEYGLGPVTCCLATIFSECGGLFLLYIPSCWMDRFKDSRGNPNCCVTQCCCSTEDVPSARYGKALDEPEPFERSERYLNGTSQYPGPEEYADYYPEKRGIPARYREEYSESYGGRDPAPYEPAFQPYRGRDLYEKPWAGQRGVPVNSYSTGTRQLVAPNLAIRMH